MGSGSGYEGLGMGSGSGHIGRGVGHGIRGWVAQLVERGTERPGAVLRQVRFPSATKYFFPVNF